MAPPQLVKSAASLIYTMPERKVRELLCEASRRPDVAALVMAAAEARAHPAEVAQLVDEAAEAVHLLDGLDAARASAALPLVLDALDKVAAKAEGLLRAGQGPLALEALAAVAGEVVRPDEVPQVVWKGIAGSGVLGRLAFATERAIPLCPSCACQEFVDPIDRVVARGGSDFSDALAALRTRALGRRKTAL
ncbi:hypothetical protein WJX81_002366 [Elliptochloris bilobata]|uniref:Uncharacterized protein n=1 Tax=Elliptochloris bilobata TaxID=381761 RepID=A0AAW1SEN3_9CHLO